MFFFHPGKETRYQSRWFAFNALSFLNDRESLTTTEWTTKVAVTLFFIHIYYRKEKKNY